MRRSNGISSSTEHFGLRSALQTPRKTGLYFISLKYKIKWSQEMAPKLKRNLTVDKYEDKRLFISDLFQGPKMTNHHLSLCRCFLTAWLLVSGQFFANEIYRQSDVNFGDKFDILHRFLPKIFGKRLQSRFVGHGPWYYSNHEVTILFLY